MHLPEGAPQRVLGYIELKYPSLHDLETRLQSPDAMQLKDSQFTWKRTDSDRALRVVGPYGNVFRVTEESVAALPLPDGRQPGPPSLGLRLSSVCFFCPPDSSELIGQFYHSIFQTPFRSV